MLLSNVRISCSGLHSKITDHQLHYILFNTVENYDIIHFRAIDCISYITK